MSDTVSLDHLIPEDWKAPGSPKTARALLDAARKFQSERDSFEQQLKAAEAEKTPEFKTTTDVEKHYASLYTKRNEEGQKEWLEMAHKTFGGEEKYKEFLSRAEKAKLQNTVEGIMDKDELKSLDSVLLGKFAEENNALPNGGQKPETKTGKEPDPRYTVSYGDDKYEVQPTTAGLRRFASQRVIDPKTKEEALLIEASPQAAAMYAKAMKEGIDAGTAGIVSNRSVTIKADGTVEERDLSSAAFEEDLASLEEKS